MYHVHFCLTLQMDLIPQIMQKTDIKKAKMLQRTKLRTFISELASTPTKCDILPGWSMDHVQNALDQMFLGNKSCLTFKAILNIPLVEKTLK